MRRRKRHAIRIRIGSLGLEPRCRVVIADIDPDPAGARLALGQDRHSGIVAVQSLGAQHMGLQALVQRHQKWRLDQRSLRFGPTDKPKARSRASSSSDGRCTVEPRSIWFKPDQLVQNNRDAPRLRQIRDIARRAPRRHFYRVNSKSVIRFSTCSANCCSSEFTQPSSFCRI